MKTYQDVADEIALSSPLRWPEIIEDYVVYRTRNINLELSSTKVSLAELNGDIERGKHE